MSTLCFQQILVPLDGSTAAEKAIPVAERIARASGGKIELLDVSTIHSNPINLQDLIAMKLKMESAAEEIDRAIRALQRDALLVERAERCYPVYGRANT